MESQNQLTKSNMESQLPESLESTHTQNAWSIFGLLLVLTRPVSLTEIASRFDSIYGSPSYIRFLCSIPNSPLHLTTNEYVGVSSIGLFYIARFVSSINLEFRNHNFIGFQFERFKDGDGKVLKTYKRRKCVRGKDECDKIVKRRKMDFHEILKSFKRRKFVREKDECENIIKRRKLDFDEEEDNRTLVKLPVAEHRSSTQIYLIQDNISKSFNITINNPLDMAFSYKLFEEINSRVSWLINSNAQIWKTTAHDRENTCVCVNEKHICTLSDSDSENTSNIAKLTKENRLLNLAYLPEAIVHKTTVEGTEAEDILSRMSLREIHQMITCNRQASSDISTYQAVINWNKVNQIQEIPILADDKGEGHVDDIAVEETASDCLPKGNFQENITMRIRSIMPSLGKLKSKMPLQNETISAGNMLADDQKHLENSQSTDNKPKFDPWEILTSNSLTICKTQEKNDVQQCIDQQHSKREKKSNSINKNICEENDHHKERKEKHKDSKKKSFNISENNQLQEREYPKFESFTVEEEEGSGGYGTVYRARRKTDGLTFAIKCPHLKASKSHIQNEVKMLEKFGGKNFIIKYKGSFKCGELDCLVLEHVDHDRPEVLRKEIDMSQLQWYGFCMFKSLASLHKQGIVHRDVKPGNFLFSRKTNKGYLIDFNLALDLHKKYLVPEKTKSNSNLTFNHLPSATRSLPPARHKQFPSSGALGHMNNEAGKHEKPIPKNSKRKAGPAKDYTHATNRNLIKSQGGDGSVITSTKDANSHRSAERCLEPIPCQGRKELLSLVQEALQGSNSEAVNCPTSKRKRVAATPGNVERKFVCVTPMPLHSTGVPVAGAGLLKNKGDVKQKREGPCAGTKGFRAPEVLVRSAHQGQKVDVWSAGVTLLYLMIGRTPFSGDPDQNMKEIAKLRGSEDLWEVSKLHNRESSFPSDLFDIKVSQPIKLLDWCKLNTRRPDLLGIVPKSLLDLVDKCLTVNPRLRISAEEALGHPFFNPCHDALRNQRLQKQGLNLQSGIN